MDVVGAEIHEEGQMCLTASSMITFSFTTVRGVLRHVYTLFYPVDGISSYGVSDVLVFPQRLSASFHVANARNAIDNAHVVSMRRLKLQEFWI